MQNNEAEQGLKPLVLEKILKKNHQFIHFKEFIEAETERATSNKDVLVLIKLLEDYLQGL